ncbi:hypothetical protein ID866_672 [Astraeus odoratus]|nr:hypothetical protein ID866_672 [Astraeus odoratus]
MGFKAANTDYLSPLAVQVLADEDGVLKLFEPKPSEATLAMREKRMHYVRKYQEETTWLYETAFRKLDALFSSSLMVRWSTLGARLNWLPSIPKNTRGLDLDQAFLDLHRVSARPHPFNSHANDIVRDYILDRLSSVVSRYSHVKIHDDVTSNASWASGSHHGVYFEGNNILVKVEGADPQYLESGGVLLSAHFDSVSTAPGTTDDGMGVVTLMQMVKFFAKHRPKRTVIFNINNAEEDGLFLEHPWANICDVFLNLEGAAAGGRPLLFRATSTIPLHSWTSSYIPHPHANVLSADSFSRGTVRSDTDYSVYEKAGLEGLDFAFYRGRSRYHTKYDSVPGMNGGKSALWAMMENTHGASVALANQDDFHVQPLGLQERPVYFDLFGAALVLFSLNALFVMNVVLLTVGPIVLLLLVYSQHIVRIAKRFHWRHRAHVNGGDAHEESLGERTLRILKNIGRAFWSSASFWVTLIISAGLQVILVISFVKLNPFIIHSHPYLVLTSALLLAYLSMVVILAIPLTKGGIVPAPEQRKLEIFLQMYIFTWLVVVFSTAVMRKTGIGGTYLFTFWNAAVLLGAVLACVEAMTSARGFEPEVDPAGRDGYEAVPGGAQADGENGLRDAEVSESTETTPLLGGNHGGPRILRREEQGAIGWWILQLLVAVPFPVILFFHVAIMVLSGQNQTLTDGIDPVTVYTLVSILALVIILPMAPFAINAHRLLTIAVLVIFIVTTLYAWLAFPFTQQDPLKVYFAQTVDLSPSGKHIERVTTAFTGPKQYLQSHILPHLPSAYNASVVCYDAPDKLGLETCKWEVGEDMYPSPGGQKHDKRAWVSSSTASTGEHSAHITIRGHNTRNCYIDIGNRRISRFEVSGNGGKGTQVGYDIPSGGLDTIRLWSRDFGKEFGVDIEWMDGNPLAVEDVKGRVSCGWAEYESATAGGGSTGGMIPSLEEAIALLPEWAVVSKSASALFNAGYHFEIDAT